MTIVYTARVSYRGADRLDITRKSATGDGLAFAPSWSILRPALDLRAVCAALAHGTKAALDNGADDRVLVGAEMAQRIESSMWALYVPAYLAEMRSSYRRDRGPWERLLARESVTLVCYCTDAEHCHRTVLARDVLAKLGTTFRGEYEVTP